MPKLPNDGSGVELALATCAPFTLCNDKGARIYMQTTHPIPVISRETFRATGRVIDATVGYTSELILDKQAGKDWYLWIYQGEFYSPGLCTEDGLTMPCIWQ